MKRYKGKELKRRIKALVARGVPCTVCFAEKGDWYQLVVRTRRMKKKRFVHLSLWYVARTALKHDWHYHISVAKKEWMKEAKGSDQTTEALQHVMGHFRTPKKVVFDVEWVNGENSVVHLAWWDATLWPVYYNLQYLREYWGAHPRCNAAISF